MAVEDSFRRTCKTPIAVRSGLVFKGSLDSRRARASTVFGTNFYHTSQQSQLEQKDMILIDLDQSQLFYLTSDPALSVAERLEQNPYLGSVSGSRESPVPVRKAKRGRQFIQSGFTALCPESIHRKEKTQLKEKPLLKERRQVRRIHRTLSRTGTGAAPDDDTAADDLTSISSSPPASDLVDFPGTTADPVEFIRPASDLVPIVINRAMIEAGRRKPITLNPVLQEKQEEFEQDLKPGLDQCPDQENHQFQFYRESL
ncbi:hypothetical protein MUK42_26857 [Musa troglodytarum]|uniref:Uncharacterized protein n=1 Tax=Musa troglodytarum TaxID=320322 RepID=A0A9E7FZZ7_9LILI|nr:hypothetical protein MUK42_26857 [Musa troglodytarum]